MERQLADWKSTSDWAQNSKKGGLRKQEQRNTGSKVTFSSEMLLGSPKRQSKLKVHQELLSMEPTDPPLENKSPEVSVWAMGYQPPGWIRPNPNYNDSDDEDLNVMNQPNAISDISAGENSNSAPQQLAIEVPDEDVIRHARE